MVGAALVFIGCFFWILLDPTTKMGGVLIVVMAAYLAGAGAVFMSFVSSIKQPTTYPQEFDWEICDTLSDEATQYLKDNMKMRYVGELVQVYRSAFPIRHRYSQIMEEIDGFLAGHHLKRRTHLDWVRPDRRTEPTKA